MAKPRAGRTRWQHNTTQQHHRSQTHKLLSPERLRPLLELESQVWPRTVVARATTMRTVVAMRAMVMTSDGESKREWRPNH